MSDSKLKVVKVDNVIAGMFTVKEASLSLGGEKTGWTGKKIRRLIRKGKVNATKNIGRWFFSEEQYKALVALATGKSE